MKILVTFSLTVPAIVLASVLSAGAAETSQVAPEPAKAVVAATDFETRSFISADLNADALLEYEEFRQFIALLADGGHRSAKWVSRLHLYSAAFSKIDRNEDGFVDPDELVEGEAEHGK